MSEQNNAPDELEKQAEQDFLFEEDPSNFQYPSFKKEEPEPKEESDEEVPEATEIEVQEDETTEQSPDARPVEYQRFKEVYGKYKRADREIEYLKTQNRQLYEEMQQLKQTKPQSTPQADQNEPKLEDFTDYDDYNRAVIQHEIKKSMGPKSAPQAPQAPQAQQTMPPELQDAAVKTDQIIRDHIAKNDPDFRTNGYVPQALAPFVVGSDKIIELSYYFAANQDTAKRLCSMAPESIIREIGRLEGRLKPYNGTPTRVESRAPRGINTSTSTGKTRTTKDPSKMTQAEYRAWRKAGGGS